MFRAITVYSKFYRLDGVYVVHCPFCSHDHAHYNAGFNIAHCMRGRYFVRKEVPDGEGNRIQNGGS